jgi:hypothetical protein
MMKGLQRIMKNRDERGMKSDTLYRSFRYAEFVFLLNESICDILAFEASRRIQEHNQLTLDYGVLFGARRMIHRNVCDETVPSNQVCALAMYVKELCGKMGK